ncbi:DUF2235 domain-containing protein [Rhodobacteraceae bacterium N5(2021)]|uniref:DUF2235 domain-containing protein n=1 Tax=Gymnodinialimonas phycosphaerae TaxID=2841589 RepID=A0A975YE58_9RHOB|nr:DUF2235 domain-containing protein [Gymnodinialimonas phycosphaerae]MBY4893257.1 DUF2235 domain-containing protein [Gymnodinialimonas phycosphaerae]
MRCPLPRSDGIWGWLPRVFGGFRQAPEPAPTPQEICTHVILLDGTMSSLAPGDETNIGLTYRLLMDLPRDAGVRIYYEPGIQWRGLRRAHEVMAGIGINRQICRAYAWLSASYRPGDRVILMGYSRGAYAVRSLGGLIDQMGLLRPEALNQARVEEIYELYRTGRDRTAVAEMTAAYCRADVPVTFLGIYDTVRALGIRYPLVWRFLPLPHPYHTHTLGPHIEVARQALALDETRVAYRPILWDTSGAEPGQSVVQMWFKGSHGDIGGQLNGRAEARPRANVALTWMLEEAEATGLRLPPDWRARFPADPDAPSVGNFTGFGKFFWERRRREVGRDASEVLHPSAAAWAKARGIELVDLETALN